jgi:O-antigen/teichoic acid export membrane protein
LLQLWVGKELVSAYSLVVVLALGYMVNLTQHSALLIIIAKGQHGPLGWWTIAEGVANIVLSVIWGRSHGLLGVAMGTIVPMLAVKLLIQPWYALKAAEMSAWEYLHKGLGRPLLAGLLFFVTAEMIRIGADTVPLFVGTVFVQIIIFLACTWFLGLTGAERQWLRAYARQHLGWPALHRAPELRPQSTEADLP